MAVAEAQLAGAPTQHEWDQLARRSKRATLIKKTLLYGFLIGVSVPLILPYFWLYILSVSTKASVVDTVVMWNAMSVIMPAIIAVWLWSLYARTRRQLYYGIGAIALASIAAFSVVVLPDLHLNNFRFLINRNFNNEVIGTRVVVVPGSISFPSVWASMANSLYLAGAQTLIVVVVASMAGYYLSRFSFPGRSGMLRSLLVLHAFPVLTLIIPLFLILNKIHLLDSLTGVILVLVGFELPFAIFIMKGFFDSVPWDIEMSAMADGASRRQAFVRIVLPRVGNGLIAISVFSFIRGWEEYIFVFTFLIRSTNWTMSLYMFFVRDDLMGVDYGIVAAVGAFYLLPSLILYMAAQKYLTQMSVGGVKG